MNESIKFQYAEVLAGVYALTFSAAMWHLHNPEMTIVLPAVLTTILWTDAARRIIKERRATRRNRTNSL